MKRFIAHTAVLAVALSGLAAAPNADAGIVPTPAPSQTAAAQWMAAQLDGSIAVSSYFGDCDFSSDTPDDYCSYDDQGLTIDLGFGMMSAGAPQAQIADVAADVNAAWGEYTDSYGTLVGGAMGKALAFMTDAGIEPSYSKVTALQAQVYDEAPVVGRVHNTPADYDWTNVIGQAFAAKALAAAGSPLADEVTDFLLLQQCADGYFTQDLNPDLESADQSCDARSATASVDATAQAVINLAPQIADPAVAAAITSAGAWLASRQLSNGSVDDNANSTGLSAVAMDVAGAGDTAAAALWMLNHQASELKGCSTSPLKSSVGAIALDDQGLTDGTDDGITQDSEYQWRKATADGVRALAFLPQRWRSAAVVSAPATAKAGSRVQIAVEGLTRGMTLCVRGAVEPRLITGRAGAVDTFTLRVKDVTGKRSIIAAGVGQRSRTKLKVT